MRLHSVSTFLIHVLALSVVSVAVNCVWADPARFWISTSNIGTTGPQAPNIPGLQNGMRTVNIWAQPATLGSGAFNAATNPFKRLQNFSLNLVADSSIVNFMPGSVVVYNPIINGSARFQFVHDGSANSTTPIESEGPFDTTPYHLHEISGFTVNSSAAGFGGASCDVADPYCALTGNGSPAWLVATAATQTISDAGTSEYFLQIGSRGMNSPNETSAQTLVSFGLNTSSIYNADSNTEMTLSGDVAHFSLQAQPTSAAVQTNWSGGNVSWDQLAGGTAPSWLNNVAVNGGVVTVNGSGQANLTTINNGRLEIAGGSSLASDVLVNAAGSVSGAGWIASNMTLAGTLNASANGPLQVTGNANINGGQITLSPGYSQPPNTTATLNILKAGGTISGTFAVMIGQSLGTGLSLSAVQYSAQSVSIQVTSTGVPGDYNGNGTVDAADYIVWRNSVGQTGSGLAADGDNNGTVNALDYSIWRTRFGATAGIGSLAIGGLFIPEPGSGVTAIVMVLCAVADRRRRYRSEGMEPPRLII